MCDNFHFDMVGVPMTLALQVAFSDHNKAVAWAERPGKNAKAKKLVLFWTVKDSASSDLNRFPSPIDAEAAVALITGWLKEQDYGPQPDHDGDNHKGCRVYNEDWGHVDGDWSAFAAIEPEWLMFGK